MDFSKSQRTWVDIFWDKYKIDNQQEQGFVENFVDAISKPIHENERNIEYIPTQVLAEYIRYLGYDGIAYSSSLGAGTNYVLFCGPAPEKSEEHKTPAITDIPPYSEYLEFENAKWYTVQVQTAYTLVDRLFEIG